MCVYACAAFALKSVRGSAKNTAAAVRAFAAFIASALANKLAPEDADIQFTMSLLPPDLLGCTADAYESSILGTGAYCLNDVLVEGEDVQGAAVPLMPAPSLNALLTKYQVEMEGASLNVAGAGAADPRSTVDSLRRAQSIADAIINVSGYAHLKALLPK